MIRTLIVLCILGICAFIGYQVQTLPLYVRFYNDLNNSYFQTPFLAWILISLLAAMLLFLIFKVLWFVWRSPKIFSRSSQARKESKAHRLLQQGLSALSLGNYRQAEKKLVKGGQLAAQIGQSPVLYYEYAASAADYQQANERRDQYFLLAREYANNKENLLARLNEAESQVANGEYTAAIKSLQQLQNKDPRNPKIINLLDSAYVHSEQWALAWQNLSGLRNHISEANYRERRKLYARGMLQDTSAVETFEQLQTAWKNLPADIRADKGMLLQYANSLVENGHAEQAEKLLAAELKQHQDLDLLQAYSQLRGINFAKALKNLENLQAHFPDNAVYLYCLALVAYRAEDLDKAAQYVESSLKLQPSAEAFALWGRILEARQQPEAALAAYRQGVSGLLEQEALAGELLPPPVQTPVAIK